MSAANIHLKDDFSFLTTITYDRLFEVAKNAGLSLGGKLKAEDLKAGFIQFKFRYGINPGGIKVGVQFRCMPDGSTETVVRGRFSDAFDTMGAASAKARAVLSQITANLDREFSIPSPATPKLSAPIIGVTTMSHRGKSKTTTTLLAFFLGGLGIHRFYIGSWGLGLIYLGLTICSLLGVILSIVDLVRYITMSQQKFDAKYNYSPVGPLTL